MAKRARRDNPSIFVSGSSWSSRRCLAGIAAARKNPVRGNAPLASAQLGHTGAARGARRDLRQQPSCGSNRNRGIVGLRDCRCGKVWNFLFD